MAKLFALTADQQKRVGRVVQDFEHRAPVPRNPASETSPPSATFWAELTGESGTNPGRYSFKKVYPSGAAWADANPAVTVGTFSAIEANAVPDLTGKRVLLTFAGYDGSTPVYHFTAVAAAAARRSPTTIYRSACRTR